MKSMVLVLMISTVFSAQLTAEALLDSMTKVMTPENSQSKMRQIIHTSSGSERTFEYDSFSSNMGENVLLKYTKPKKVKGNAFLMKNNADDIWVYFPRTRRVRKLASHFRNQKVQGSDFSYEDFAGGNTWKEDYTVQRLEDTNNEYVLKLIPKPKLKSSYKYLTVFMRKMDYFPLKLEYYNLNSIHLKTLNLEDIIQIEGYPTAMKMIMVNHVEGTQTRLETIEVKYDVTFPDNYFSENNMRK